MTSKLTKERIEWLHYAATGLAANGTEMAMSPQDVIALTECCLAAMDSEPVAWIVHARTGDQLTTDGGYVANAEGILGLHSTPLYRHAQQPVVRPAPECQHQWRYGGANKLQNQKQCIKCGRVELDAQPAPVVPKEWAIADAVKFCKETGRQDAGAAMDAWNACRAAMLQAGNSPVIPDGYVMVPKEMTDEIGEAIAMQANCCGGIALDIYDAMLAAAPQEVK